MTKQEAVEYGMRWKNAIIDRGDIEWSDAIQFLNMAIQALEQETVSQETYDHEFNLRKEFEMKVFELEKKIAEQESIIHCKECKHWHEWENGIGACRRRNIMWVDSDYDDYCSWAERRAEQ